MQLQAQNYADFSAVADGFGTQGRSVFYSASSGTVGWALAMSNALIGVSASALSIAEATFLTDWPNAISLTSSLSFA